MPSFFRMPPLLPLLLLLLLLLLVLLLLLDGLPLPPPPPGRARVLSPLHSTLNQLLATSNLHALGIICVRADAGARRGFL
jgi:hypothetical protein